MKNIVFLLIGLLLLTSSNASAGDHLKNNPSVKGAIDIYCTSDLYGLTKKLAEEYCIQNPDVKFNVIKETETTKANIYGNRNSIIFSSDYNYFDPDEKSIWKTVIGRNVIVPIINAENPFIESINKQGLSAKELAQLFNNPEMSTWGSVLGNGKDAHVKCYIINDESIISTVAKFMNHSESEFHGEKIDSKKKLIRLIQNDPYAIGFCNLTDIIDLNSLLIIDNIKLLPIDKNGNGILDYMEQIYTDINVFSRGVWIGKYPKSLFNNIYTISPVKPKSEIEIAFLKWVFMDGQQFLLHAGYTDLVFNERSAYVDKLSDRKINLSPITENEVNSSLRIIIILVLNLAVILICIAGFQFLRNRNEGATEAKSILSPVFNKNSVLVPDGLFYDKTHTWAYMEKDGNVQIGIDDFLQRITGPITRIKLRNTGDKVKKGDQILSIIQYGKQITIYAPISGIIKERNNLLNTNSSLINSSPYSEGWVYLIEPSNWIRENKFLIMREKYNEWLSKEFSRLRDFLTETLNPNSKDYAHVILQDGGELNDGILENLGPEVWEDFQTSFIDTAQTRTI